MGYRMQKKHTSGAATSYISRNQALKKLQLSLPDFRRLCILKGIYPVEPTNKKKASKGSTVKRTFYHLKDVRFLSHEPVLEKFREQKAFLKRLKKAVGRGDQEKATVINQNWPKYKLDHIVKERYPMFSDSLRDLDDPLCMLFMFATLPKAGKIDATKINLCRRLTVEFMNYIIVSNSLRKVFISIKGYYYQAEIKGQPVTWLVPHNFAYDPPNDVDFRILSIFTDFYCTMLGFINFRLYNSINLHYPPKLSEPSAAAISYKDRRYAMDTESANEKLASLNFDLAEVLTSIHPEEETQIDDFQDSEAGNSEAIQKAKEEEWKLNNFKKLFKDCKFYLSREVPMTQFVFVVKAFGGQISWDPSQGIGSTFTATDEDITHHIVDRPKIQNMDINRAYVQPQWVFDCVNAQRLLPVGDYVPGSLLPPHLSPFVDTADDVYIPPEARLQMDDDIITKESSGGMDVSHDSSDSEADDDDDDADESEHGDDEVAAETANRTEIVAQGTEDWARLSQSQKRRMMKRKRKTMVVSAGKIEETDEIKKVKEEERVREEEKLAIMMITKKKKKIFDRMKAQKDTKLKKIKKLTLKREKIEELVKKNKKTQKKKTKAPRKPAPTIRIPLRP